eukprot:13830-Heterococcus_DN1.PRE.1
MMPSTVAEDEAGAPHLAATLCSVCVSLKSNICNVCKRGAAGTQLHKEPIPMLTERMLEIECNSYALKAQTLNSQQKQTPMLSYTSNAPCALFVCSILPGQ